MTVTSKSILLTPSELRPDELRNPRTERDVRLSRVKEQIEQETAKELPLTSTDEAVRYLNKRVSERGGRGDAISGKSEVEVREHKQSTRP